MVLSILKERAEKITVDIFDLCTTKKVGIDYPYRQLVGPLPKPVPSTPITPKSMKLADSHWNATFQRDLLSWLQAFQWIPGRHQVSFMELSMDFELYAGRTLPAAPQAVYKGEMLSLPERAKVLKLGLAILHRHMMTGHLFLDGVLTKCTALGGGGGMVVGLSAPPCFTCRHHMLPMMLNPRKYRETVWVTKPQRRNGRARAG